MHQTFCQPHRGKSPRWSSKSEPDSEMYTGSELHTITDTNIGHPSAIPLWPLEIIHQAICLCMRGRQDPIDSIKPIFTKGMEQPPSQATGLCGPFEDLALCLAHFGACLVLARRNFRRCLSVSNAICFLIVNYIDFGLSTI